MEKEEKKLNNVIIRKGERKDCESIASLIKELACYEKLPEEAKLSGKDLERDGFDCDPPYFYTIIAELVGQSEEEKDTAIAGKVIGYVLYYYAYNTRKGQDIHLEDFYVIPQYRFQGIGEKLLRYLAKITMQEGLGKVSLECLDWNETAIKFYRKHGADNVTLTDNLLNYRFVNKVMKQLAEG